MLHRPPLNDATFFITCPMTVEWHSDLSEWKLNWNHRTTLLQYIYSPLNRQINTPEKSASTFNFFCLSGFCLTVNWSDFVLVTLTTHSFLFLPHQTLPWLLHTALCGSVDGIVTEEGIRCRYISHFSSGLLMPKLSLRSASCKHSWMLRGASAINLRKANGFKGFQRRGKHRAGWGRTLVV